MRRVPLQLPLPFQPDWLDAVQQAMTPRPHSLIAMISEVTRLALDLTVQAGDQAAATLNGLHQVVVGLVQAAHEVIQTAVGVLDMLDSLAGLFGATPRPSPGTGG